MKKIIRIFVLIAILILGGVYLNSVFKTNHIYNNTFNDFKKLTKENEVNVLFLGSSHVYTAYNPLIINDKTGLTTYNLGSDGQRLPITNLVLEEALNLTCPELVVLEIYEPTLKIPSDDKVKGFQLRALDHVSNFSIKKLQTTFAIYSIQEALGVYSPLVRNHEKWVEHDFFNLKREDSLNNDHYFYYGGFYGRDFILSEENRDYKTFKNFVPNTQVDERIIPEKEITYIREFIKTARKCETEVLIITSPYLKANYHDADFLYSLKEVCENLKVPYLNLNDHYAEMNLGFYDFSDLSHLNSYGAYKSSRYIAEYINENYVFKNKNVTTKELENKKLVEFEENFSPSATKKFNYNATKALTDSLVIDKIRLTKVNKTFLGSIIFKNHNMILEKLKRYKMGFHIIPAPSDTMLVNKLSKKNKIKHEIADFYMTEQTQDSVSFRFESNIEHIEALKFFLYDVNGYKGIVGNKILIEDVPLQHELL